MPSVQGARRRPRRQVVVVLEAEQYDVLHERAVKHGRDAWQQARWIVLRALDEDDPNGEPIQDVAS